MRWLVAGMVATAGPAVLSGQTAPLRGVVRHGTTGDPVANAVVAWIGAPGRGSYTSVEGRFQLERVDGTDRLVVLAIGFRPDTVGVVGAEPIEVRLEPAPLTLAPLVVAAARAIDRDLASRIVSDLDFTLKAPQSSQELLRLAPGLIIAQHAGGGKAEQIFLRGFDADHGTDVAVSVDDVPVNLVSHAHGQGYADLHFVMPEVIDRVEVRKGGHDPRDGNLATAGAVSLRTRDRVGAPTAWARGGSFGTATLGGLVPFGGGPDAAGGYLGVSGSVSDGPFLRSQNFRRANGFAKWTQPIARNAQLVLSSSTYSARWDASGQVPARAVRDRSIGRFGSIDPTEGGRTSRSDLWVGLRSRGDGGHAWQIAAYATKYRLDLFSNFTFFLNDSLAGDGIAQMDDRTLVGLHGEITGPSRWSGLPGRFVVGAALRSDFADLHLANQTARELTNTRVASRVSEQNASAWVRQQVRLGDRVGLDLGLRGDLCRFDVVDRGRSGPAGRDWAGKLSPKAAASVELGGLTGFAAISASFHSNDARDVVTAPDSATTLPRATTVETGLRRQARWGTVGVSLWRTDLQSELLFVGDEGTTEAGGRTRRHGLDLETRIRIFPWLWGDLDLSLARGRLRDEPAGADAIPLAPRRTLTAGLSVRDAGPLTANLRIRHVGDRPADESGEITALGATIADLSAAWDRGRWALPIGVDNLLNVEWNEAQFATTSRLRGEPAPVTELHFTPGAPRRFEIGFRWHWLRGR